MADYITLLGAEDVRSAANTMSGAAREMLQAASNIDDTMRQHQRFMDDWLARFWQVLADNSSGAIWSRGGRHTALYGLATDAKCPPLRKHRSDESYPHVPAQALQNSSRGSEEGLPSWRIG